MALPFMTRRLLPAITPPTGSLLDIHSTIYYKIQVVL
jgi:hypothetical protein